ncbi:MAG TPA: hypothetical protein VMU14_22805 [Acidimicrobiales bacterium]|nr:hypothetical protein [Acidimicrobiales bacterium]
MPEGRRARSTLNWTATGTMQQDKDREERESPLATIRASCPTCGDVELTSRDVVVRVCAADNAGAYAFRCPSCRMAVSKQAESKIVDLLVSSGVRLSVWHLPAELAEPHYGEAISYDDLLEFHYAIQRPGWFERLVSSVGQEDQPL